MKVERRQPTRAELARIASPGLVLRRIAPAEQRKKNFRAKADTGDREGGQRREEGADEGGGGLT